MMEPVLFSQTSRKWSTSLMAAIVLIAGTTCGIGSTTGRVQAGQTMQNLQRWTNIVARAFAKEDQIRIYFTQGQEGSMLHASWKPPRVTAEKFNYASATLEGDKSPPAMPVPDSGWREIKVLAQGESRRLLRAAANQIVPATPNHGIFAKYALGEAVVFRDAQNQIRIVPTTDKPPEIVIDRRFTRQELVSTTAKALESDLHALYPKQMEFVMPVGQSNKLRWAFIDFTKRQAVVLYVPPIGKDSRETQRLGFRLSNLASFILVDNVWTFLKNPVSSSGRTLHQFIQWPATLFEPRLRGQAANIPPLAHGPGMDLQAWEKWLDDHTNTRCEQGSIRLLIDGDRFYRVLEDRIAGAQSNINLHVCIFDTDDVAIGLAALLKQRSTNIEVKVTFDRLNTRGAERTPPATPMREGFTPPHSSASYLRSGANVHVRPMPNPGFTCDHSKIYLIDAQYVYVGGMNVGREYRYEWHDLMAEVQGPVVASYQKEFDKKWAQLGIWGDCGLAAESLSGTKAALAGGSGTNRIQLRRIYTKTFGRQIRKAELAALGRASSYVYLENPYLFSKSMVVALARARLRGADVRVIMPSENDLAAGQKSNLVIANYLLEHGVRVYLYPGMTHVKALLADGWVCFGSANGDALSLRLNREADLATSDPNFAEQFRRQLFEADFARSRALTEPVEVAWTDHLVDVLLAPL